MSVPKHFVFDDDGKLTEVRGYKDEIVVERWGLVYDEEERLVGLRPLSVKEVIPQSILDKMKFWRKPKPLTQVLSIDFIGLIQYIGMIYKIRKVVTIEEIEKILEIINIKKVDVIGEITTIRDLTHTPREIIQNPSFEQEFAGWYVFGTVIADTTKMHFGKYSCKFSNGVLGSIGQQFGVCLDVDWFTEFYLWLRSSTTGDALQVGYFYSDGEIENEILSCTVVNSWQRKTLSPTAGKHIEYIQFAHLETYTNDVYVDCIALVF